MGISSKESLAGRAPKAPSAKAKPYDKPAAALLTPKRKKQRQRVQYEASDYFDEDEGPEYGGGEVSARPQAAMMPDTHLIPPLSTTRH